MCYLLLTHWEPSLTCGKLPVSTSCSYRHSHFVFLARWCVSRAEMVRTFIHEVPRAGHGDKEVDKMLAA